MIFSLLVIIMSYDIWRDLFAQYFSINGNTSQSATLRVKSLGESIVIEKMLDFFVSCHI